MSVIQGSCFLIFFVFKCILFFILHTIVINYIYKKVFSGISLWICELLFGTKTICQMILLLIWHENFYSNAFSFCTAKVQNVCEGVHACVCTRGGGMHGVLL